jgi:hypothetical protein
VRAWVCRHVSVSTMARTSAGVWSKLLRWLELMMQKIAFAPSQDQPQYETLIVEDDIEEGAVHMHATVVLQEA